MSHEIKCRVYYLSQIVRRDICRHTYGDTDRTVYEYIRKSRRKNRGLFKSVIEVRFEIDDVFVYIRHHFVGKLCKSCLRITVCGGSVSVHVTEVSLSVDKRISHREILRKTYHCVIYGRVAVRMVTAEHVSDRRCGFARGFIVSQLILIHRVEYTSVYGFKTVAYIGKRTGNYDAHRVFYKRLFYARTHLDFDYFLILI